MKMIASLKFILSKFIRYIFWYIYVKRETLRIKFHFIYVDSLSRTFKYNNIYLYIKFYINQ